ncbi:MAG TPA: hypothetical protein VD794_08975 [Flavisolibacter sp.]|nr:hypothetical protein [Flavisolibacter sp.]
MNKEQEMKEALLYLFRYEMANTWWVPFCFGSWLQNKATDYLLNKIHRKVRRMKEYENYYKETF